MAKATKREKVVVADGITLELTQNEATFLADLTSLIGGSPHGSRRKYADTINRALNRAGVIEAKGGVKDVQGGPSTALYFEDVREVPE